MTLASGPVPLTTPASSTRYYFTPSLALVNGQVDILVAYSDPDQGNSNPTPQSLTYLGYTVSLSGVVSQNNGIANWINALSPQAVPASTLNYEIRVFDGPVSSSDFGEYFDTINNNGTATFNVAVVNMSGALPVVNEIPTSITVTPVPKTLTDNITAELGDPSSSTSLNEQIFEVEGAPTTGQVQGTFMIYNSSAAVVVAPSTAFNFTDSKAHVFSVGAWNATNFGELVEVWNLGTNLADLRLSLINATTGVVTPGWTSLTELTSITKVGWQFVSPAGAGMIVLADGSDAGGRGFFEYVVNDSTSASGGLGGSISKSVRFHYTGTVTQDAQITSSGITNEYVVHWVDGNGLTIELIDANLNVLETYNIANANGTSTLTELGNGELLVDYRVQSSSTSAVDDFVILNTALPPDAPPIGTSTDMIMRDSANGNYEIYDIGNNSILAADALGQVGLEWQVSGVGRFFGSDTSDLILRSSNTGAFEIYDISNNNITSAASMGQVGLEWQVAGFGDFSSNPGETDMLMRNSNTGACEFYDISNNAITSTAALGAIGLGWLVSGFGDFSGNLGESDMLIRNSNTGAFEVYDISNNTITSAAAMGAVGLEWTVAGFGDFSGNANETDMLMRNSSSGAFEVYDISNNAITSAAAMGAVGLEWTVAGFGDFSGNANETDMLMRNSGTGAFEVYDISKNTITSASAMGAVGLEWQVGGIAADPPTGSLDSSMAQLIQAMASVGANAALTGAPSSVLGVADTPQQTLMAIPHY
jgi:hypothetical protein